MKKKIIFILTLMLIGLCAVQAKTMRERLNDYLKKEVYVYVKDMEFYATSSGGGNYTSANYGVVMIVGNLIEIGDDYIVINCPQVQYKTSGMYIGDNAPPLARNLSHEKRNFFIPLSNIASFSLKISDY